MLDISILTIGDEICIGQVINTNAAWMGKKCTETGCNVIAHSVIGDEKHIIISELDRLTAMSDVVLITGGLGPTQDDITKKVLAEYFGTSLELHQPTLDRFTKRYKKIGLVINEKNRSQAIIPVDCTILENSVGAAPGMMFEKDGKYVISMPGVPIEMQYIMTEHVLDFLKKEIETRHEDIILFKTLNTIGIPESYLAESLGDTDSFINGGSLAYLPSYRGVRLRIGMPGNDFEKAAEKLAEVEEYIRSKSDKFIFAEGETAINIVTGELLIEKQKTVSVAESCTGGMLGASFTDIPGSSAFFEGGILVYSNEAKINILGVNKETIEAHGAVSEETALQLAENVRLKFGTDYGIGITGIAGPGGGTEEKPVGTVWISLSDKNETVAEKFVFWKERQVNRELSVSRALAMLYNKLKG